MRPRGQAVPQADNLRRQMKTGEAYPQQFPLMLEGGDTSTISAA
jgi:hypothetical protein